MWKAGAYSFDNITLLYTVIFIYHELGNSQLTVNKKYIYIFRKVSFTSCRFPFVYINPRLSNLVHDNYACLEQRSGVVVLKAVRNWCFL